VLFRPERPHPRLFAVAFDSRLVDVNNVSVLNPSADLFVFKVLPARGAISAHESVSRER